MQKFGKTLITNVGRQMLTEVDGAKGKITYTKAKLYTEQIGKMSEEQIVALTNLDGLQLETSLDVTNVEDTTVTVSASFNNAKVTKDLAFNSIGWFARTSVDDTEKLLAITPSEIEQTIVASDNGASTTSLDIEMVFARSHDTTVVVKPIEAGLVSSSQLKEAITDLKIKLEAEFPSLKEQVKQEVNDQINALSALNNSSGGNNLYNQKIDLDVYSTIGITKFLGCQLQSTGSMYGFDPSTTNLYGWIFNVPKWNGATQYDQIVYICDYGKGTLIYIRTKVDNTGSNQEDFEKLTTDKDLTFFNDKLKNIGKVKTIDGICPDDEGNISLKNTYVTKANVYEKGKIDSLFLENNKKFVKSIENISPDSSGNISLFKDELRPVYGYTASYINSIAINEKDNIFFTYMEFNNIGYICKFDYSLKLLDKISKNIKAPEYNLAVHDGYLYEAAVGGLIKFDMNLNIINKYDCSDSTHSLSFDNKGNLYTNSSSEIIKTDLNLNVIKKYTIGNLTFPFVRYCLYSQKLYGFSSNLIFEFDESSLSVLKKISIDTGKVLSMCFLPDKSVVVATEIGLIKFDENLNIIKKADDLSFKVSSNLDDLHVDDKRKSIYWHIDGNLVEYDYEFNRKNVLNLFNGISMGSNIANDFLICINQTYDSKRASIYTIKKQVNFLDAIKGIYNLLLIN